MQKYGVVIAMEMKTIRTLYDDDGFTLIEALMALAILTIGILALYSLQTVVIKGNATAIGLTTASTWAADRVEQLLALDYDDVDLQDDGVDGAAGLGNATDTTADGNAVSPDGKYTIFWNVADFMTPIPGAPTISYVKAIRVIVQRNDFGTNKQVVLNYYKHRAF